MEQARISLSLGQVDRKHYPIAREALLPPQRDLCSPLSQLSWKCLR